MKTLIFCLLTNTAFAQIYLENGNMDIYTDSTVSIESAELIFERYELGRGMKIYDRYIYAENATYYRPGIGLFRKPKIYIVDNGKLIKVKPRDPDQL